MEPGETKIDEGEIVQPARISGIMRIPGMASEREKEILESIKIDLFDKPRIMPAEREKTPDEVEVVSAIINELPNFIKSYGGKPVDLQPNHVHAVNYDKSTKQYYGTSTGWFMARSIRRLSIWRRACEYLDVNAGN